MPPDPRVTQIIALLQRQQVEQAAKLRDALIADAPSPEARFASALVDRLTGDLPRAIEALEALHRDAPAHPAFRAELATTRVMAGRVEEALPVLEELARAQPNQPFAHYWIGQAHLRSFRGAEAVAAFERVRQLNPQDRNVLQPLAAACLAAGRPRRAEECCRELLQLDPDNAEALSTLAAAVEQQGRIGETESVFRRILASHPTHAAALAGLARILQTRGERDEARALLEPALKRPDPHPTLVSTCAALCATPEQRAPAIDAARRALAQPSTSAQDRAGLCFALARMLDAEEAPDEAFELYAQGNALYPRRYAAEEKRRETDETIRTFTAQAIRALPRPASPSGRPVFIVGMPRSGTTLAEQILAAHPDVHGAGELQELRTIWRELRASRPGGLAGLTRTDVESAARRYLAHLERLDPSAPRITDKMPHNFEQLGLINLLFPSAHVVHCTRDPLDTCVSCFTVQFGMAHAYATSLSDLGHAYGEYRRLMAHWRSALDIPVLEFSYEQTVADVESSARRLLDFLGLPWNDACLRFYETERAVTTASVDQVRRPIYGSSVGRWRRYRRHLTPLIEALRAAGVETDEA